MVERIDSTLLCLDVGVDDEIKAKPFGSLVTKIDHLAELPAGIDM